MTCRLNRRHPSLHVAAFGDAPDMIAWLGKHLESCVLLCLDHDLVPEEIGTASDPGSGRDVADYLATRMPVCPAIIHTTNTLAAPGMELALADAGWVCSRVVPYADLQWIGEVWIDEVNHALHERLGETHPS